MQETLSQHIIEARKRFPRGLEQPEGSLRFGADALLLAAFAARHLPPDRRGPDRRGPDKRGPDKHGVGAARHAPTLVAELGCGCGAALLGLAMLRPQIRGLGLERERPLVLAAESNATRLGLSDQLRFSALDLEDTKALATLRAPVGIPGLLPTAGAFSSPDKGNTERHPDAAQAQTAQPDIPQPDSIPSGTTLPDTALASTAQPDSTQPGMVLPACNRLDAVLANPPYDRGGRPSPRHMRERALRTATSTDSHISALDAFCRAAATLLCHQGRFFCIYDAKALPRLCAALNAVRLGVRRILPVQSHRDEPARRVLVEARKNAAHDTVLETPLILHDAPETFAPVTSAPEIIVSGSNDPGSNEPGDNTLCGDEPCGRRSCAGGPLWSAGALAFCPWLGVADSCHTADNAFTAP